MKYVTVLERSSGVSYVLLVPEYVLDHYDSLEDYLDDRYDFDLENCDYMIGNSIQFKNIH